MKAKDWFLLVLLVIVGGAFALLGIEKSKNRKLKEVNEILRKEKEEYKKAYLDLLEQYFKDNPEVEPSLLRELQRVRQEIDEADTATHKELDSVVRHLVSKEYSKAIKDLAKVLEVKLKEKVEDDGKHGKYGPSLTYCLNQAKDRKWIGEQDYHNALQLKEARNQESHELAVNLNPLDAGLMVFAGIKVLYAVARRR